MGKTGSEAATIGFNSNMVRLRGRYQDYRSGEISRFQFQYGAIKSETYILACEKFDTFQFQYGAIKSATFHRSPD